MSSKHADNILNERFKVIPKIIGPGHYNWEEGTGFVSRLMAKPGSLKGSKKITSGVGITKAIRFPPIKDESPGVGHYEIESFVE